VDVVPAPASKAHVRAAGAVGRRPTPPEDVARVQNARATTAD